MILDNKLSEVETSILKSFIGHQLEQIIRDPLCAGLSTYGSIGIKVDGETYQITLLEHNVDDFFGTPEQVSWFEIKKSEQTLKSLLSGVETISINCKETIKEIKLVNDNVVLNDKDSYSYTYAIIIVTNRKTHIISSGEWFLCEIHINSIDSQSIETLRPIEEIWGDWGEEGKEKLLRQIVVI